MSNTTRSTTGMIGAISATVGTYPGRDFLAADAVHAWTVFLLLRAKMHITMTMISCTASPTIAQRRRAGSSYVIICFPSSSRKNARNCPVRTGFKYIPAPTLIMKEPMASFFGIPRLIRIGRMITPIATTAPAPNRVEKIAVVTVERSTQIMTGLSPPSSTVLRISVSAIPVCRSTRPNQAPNTTLTRTLPQPSGPDWKTFVIASTKLISVTPG